MATIRIPTTLRTLTGGASSVEADGATVGEVLANLDAAHLGWPPWTTTTSSAMSPTASSSNPIRWCRRG